MATRGENCNDWPRTVMTGGCLLVAFAPDGATGNDDDDDDQIEPLEERKHTFQKGLS